MFTALMCVSPERSPDDVSRSLNEQEIHMFSVTAIIHHYWLLIRLFSRYPSSHCALVHPFIYPTLLLFFFHEMTNDKLLRGVYFKFISLLFFYYYYKNTPCGVPAMCNLYSEWWLARGMSPKIAENGSHGECLLWPACTRTTPHWKYMKKIRFR